MNDLSTRINRALVIASVLISLAFAVILWSFQNRRVDTVRGKVALLLETLIESHHDDLASALLDQRPQGIEHRLQLMRQVPGVQAVTAYDEQGRSVAHDGPAAVDNTLPEQWTQQVGARGLTRTMSYDGQQSLMVLHPIETGDTRLGYIRVQYSLLDIAAERQLSIALFIALVATMLLVLVIVLRGVLSKAVVKPIQSLTQVIREVETQGPGASVDVKEDDTEEIRELSDAFNRMSKERAAVDRQLAASRRLLETTLDSTTDGIVVCGDDGYVLAVNAVFIEMWHLKDKGVREGMRVDALSELMMPLLGDRPPFEQSADRADEKKSYPEELDLSDGRHFERTCHMLQIKDERSGEVWGFRDVTVRRHAVAALRESEERFRNLVNQAADAIYLSGEDGYLIDVNNETCRILGYTRAELLTMSIADIDVNWTNEEAKKDIWDHLLPGQPVMISSQHRRKDGSTFPVEVRVGMMHLGSRRLMVALARDVTERQELEDRLRQSQKMEAIGQLAGGVAHDFNNLLQAIQGYGALAQSELDESHPVQGHLQMVLQASTRAAALTRQLLNFSRRQSKHTAVVDVNALVRDLARMLRRLIGSSVQLNIEAESSLGSIRADPAQIEQILTNLCINARDAMPEGGAITVTTANRHLDAEFCRQKPGLEPGMHVVIGITDTGEGIAPEIRDRIFEPFFTTKDVGAGTGLGLSTVYAIVEQYHGLIDVDSEPGRGTTFTIYLPIHRGQLDDETTTRAATSGTNGMETILLAEDDDMVRSLAVSVLQRAGYKLIVATNGQEAVDLFNEEPEAIDLALLDVIMPRLNGIDAWQHISSRRDDLAVLFVSGYAEGRQTGSRIPHHLPILSKPFSPTQLLNRIREVFDDHKNPGNKATESS